MVRVAEPEGRQHARAFGLDIDSSAPLPGLPRAGPGPATGRTVRLDRVPAAEIERQWPARDTVRLLEDRLPEDAPGQPAATVDAHEQHGYRFLARGHGLAQVSLDGSAIAWAPASLTEPRPAFLLGRILPWACVLRGYEALHASAVSVAGQAVAITGPSGAGKTSLALALLDRGAELVTDDVLALRRTADEIHAYPGAAVVNVPAPDSPLGNAVGPDRRCSVVAERDKTAVATPVVAGPVPLAAVCFLNTTGPALIEPIRAPDPRRLLASTYVIALQRPDRLARQLDLCALIAAAVPGLDLRTGPGSDPATLAEVLLDTLERGSPPR